MQVHKYAKFFPLLEGDEFDNLVNDIRERGLREPIVTFEDAILDGRNRYRACVKAGVAPRFKPYTENGALGALHYVVSMNIRRRGRDRAGHAAGIREVGCRPTGR